MGDPELYLFDPSDLPGAAEYRAERARRLAESRRRAHGAIEAALADTDADPAAATGAVFRALFDHRYDDGSACLCSCHPRLPEGDLHDLGADCPCRRTPEERRAAFDDWTSSINAYWASPDGLEVVAAREAEEAELAVWLEDHPTVIVDTHGGMAPEQWEGAVDSRSFSFRERHDRWRIELDLRPSGRFATVWKGGDLDDEDATELRELTEGDFIAEGAITDEGYGTTPTERIRFITSVIKAHVGRAACAVHRAGRADVARRLGAAPAWCPACGTRLVDR